MTYSNVSLTSSDFGYVASTDTEKYDDLADTWSIKSALTISRTDMPNGSSLNGYGYAVGGFDNIDVNNSVYMTRYDGVSNTWTAKANYTIPRYGQAGFPLNGRIYNCGGSYDNLAYRITSQKYDDVANSWSNIADIAELKMHISGFSVNNYGFIALGGQADPFGTITTKRYDDAANTWTARADLNTARYASASFALNNHGYTCGGATFSANGIVEKYDDVANTWTTKTSITARQLAGGFALNGFGYVAGGFSSNATQKYDDVANSWITKTAMTVASTNGPASFSIGSLQTNIIATDVALDSITTPCVAGSCTVSISVTWTNTGGMLGSFTPSVTIDGNPVVSDPPLSPVTIGPSGTVLQTFTITGMTAGPHTICPYPN
jgi:hypothetical protein